MHKTILPAIMAFVCLIQFSCSRSLEPYTIIGKVENTEKDSVYIQLPVNGKFFYWANSVKVPVDSTGHFRAIITDEVEGFTQITVKAGRVPVRARTWITPGKTDSLFLDYETPENTYYGGDRKEALALLNSFERIPNFHAFGGADAKYQKDPVAQSTYDTLMKKIALEKEQVAELLAEDKIDNSFARAIELESEVHWKSVFSATTWHHYYFKEELNRDSPFNEDWKRLYLEMFDETDMNDPAYLSSNYYRTLAEDYINMYPRISGKVMEQDTTLTQEELVRDYHNRKFERIKKELRSENQELVWSYTLFIGAIQENYEKVLMESYEELKTIYPNTPYDTVLKKHIDPIRAYHAKLEHPMSDEIIMIGNAPEFTSWEQMVSSYKGEILYVDLWATWCAPCKEEFKHKDGLYEFVNNKPIKLLYVSSDRDNAAEKWKEMVNFYDLKGENMRISKDLNNKIWKMIHNEDWQAIPRYLIVDREGNMVVKDALRPSDGQKLYDQLASYL